MALKLAENESVRLTTILFPPLPLHARQRRLQLLLLRRRLRRRRRRRRRRTRTGPKGGEQDPSSAELTLSGARGVGAPAAVVAAEATDAAAAAGT